MDIDEKMFFRFCAKFTVGDGCWQWHGMTTKKGYGRFTVNRMKKEGAHRFSYEMLVGPIPEGLVIDHLCRNRGCVNPAHLEVVTASENVRRQVSRNSKKTHCIYGHPLAGDNLRVRPGRRICLTCTKRRNDYHWARRRRAA